MDYLRSQAMQIPVAGVIFEQLRDTFDEGRDGGRVHRARTATNRVTLRRLAGSMPYLIGVTTVDKAGHHSVERFIRITTR